MKPDIDGKYHCYKCRDAFTTRQALSRHKTSKHSTVLMTYRCPYCSHEGSRAYDVLSKHVPRIHPDKTRETKLVDITEVTRAKPNVMPEKFKLSPSTDKERRVKKLRSGKL